MIFRSQKHAVLSILIATALGGVVVADAAAQSRSSERRGNKESAKAEVLYPEATRVDPKGKASSKMGSKLNKLFAAYNKQEFAETRTLADEILASADANDYDKAVANQLASQAAYNTDDNAGAKQYLQRAIALNQLDNNGHFQAMLMLAQLQLQDDQLVEGLRIGDDLRHGLDRPVDRRLIPFFEFTLRLVGALERLFDLVDLILIQFQFGVAFRHVILSTHFISPNKNKLKKKPISMSLRQKPVSDR